MLQASSLHTTDFLLRIFVSQFSSLLSTSELMMLVLVLSLRELLSASLILEETHLNFESESRTPHPKVLINYCRSKLHLGDNSGMLAITEPGVLAVDAKVLGGGSLPELGRSSRRMEYSFLETRRLIRIASDFKN